ncbi:hypothetical protein CLV63_11560 [Murinocardiopsis flavida]|uniref:Uncharacterized protein n=1 Tax=Murinocardiopsis flavida TaxID=645275 RepID=A0A2P8DDU9_9ACTN|nr:hypothetical protein [Murinocardiopsis flavida]PSK95400.1 hypothetical protein CLV63_11560 [Murinocardiopsis flavida]
MKRDLMRSLLVAAPLVLGLALTGCGSESGGASGDAAGMSAHEKGVKFAECMRENGVDMEDPEPGKGVMVKGKKGGEEGMDKAMEACEEYAPTGERGKKDPEMAKKQQEFAECMRENDVDFPDPEPGQMGIRMDKKTAEDPDFDAAMKECQPIMGDAMKGGPGGAAGGE